MKTKLCLVLSLTTGLIINSSCNNAGNKTTTTTTTYTSSLADTSKGNDVINKIANSAIEIVKVVKYKKTTNDSMRIANKKNMWVYQIGPKISTEELAGQAYVKLKGISNIYVFKKSRYEYYTIKDDGYGNYDQLMDSIGSVKKRIAAITTERVISLDLSQQCSSKKQPTISNPIKFKADSQKYKVTCLTCY